MPSKAEHGERLDCSVDALSFVPTQLNFAGVSDIGLGEQRRPDCESRRDHSLLGTRRGQSRFSEEHTPRSHSRGSSSMGRSPVVERKKCRRNRKRADSGTSRSSSSSSLSSSRSQSRRGRKDVGDLADALRFLKVGREVVPPSIFNMGSGDSLKRFFKTYEKYFDRKYSGDDRDRARHLYQFLGSDLKSCYDAIDGRHRKYRDLKVELLDIVESQRINGRETFYRKFQGATHSPEEPVKMYALRLEHLAGKAFPSKSEAKRQLCRKLRDTAPAEFLVALTGAQSTLSMLGEKEISWDRMRKVAESHDRLKREGFVRQAHAVDPQVWYSRSSAVPGDSRPPESLTLGPVVRSGQFTATSRK